MMKNSREGDGKTALITGASSGIGEELAACFGRNGFDLVLVARSREKLHTLARNLSSAHSIKASAVAIDLAQPGGPEKLLAAMKRARRHIDVLVNCAGVLEHGEFTKIPAGRHQALIDLNISALTAVLAGRRSKVRQSITN